MRPTIWKELGGGTENETADNMGWTNFLHNWYDPERREWAPMDENVESMPYGHHQICIF